MCEPADNAYDCFQQAENCVWCVPTAQCLGASCLANLTLLCDGTVQGFDSYYYDSCHDWTLVWVLLCLIFVVWVFSLALNVMLRHVRYRIARSVLVFVYWLVAFFFADIYREPLWIGLCVAFGLVVTVLLPCVISWRNRPRRFYTSIDP